MTNRIYPEDTLSEDQEDNGTMPESVQELEDILIGRKIVKAEKKEVLCSDDYYWERIEPGLILTLDNGKRYAIADNGSCCAYTDLESFFLHPQNIDHAITSVETQDGYTKWFILANMEHVLDLEVGWSMGSGYYGYGFDISVMEEEENK